jgi:YfiH family protein
VFAHHEVRVGIGVAVTDRHGGVSEAPWTALNLADHVGDSEDAVADNRRRVLAGLDGAAHLVTMRQVHGAGVSVVDGTARQPPEADVLVTATPGLALTVLVADCTPILLWDRKAGVVAAVHAGRRGLAAGVLPAAVDAMRTLRARPDRLYAVVGPGVCPEHYEVPGPMRAEVAAAVPAAAATTTTGKPALDLRAGLLTQLRAAGVDRMMVMPHCTAETPDFYSYRRDGVTGRFAGIVWIQP